MHIFVQTYIDSTEIHRHTDGQTNRPTNSQILYIEADGQTAGNQAVRQTELRTERQMYKKKDS
jgi:hypothetical protein